MYFSRQSQRRQDSAYAMYMRPKQTFRELRGIQITTENPAYESQVRAEQPLRSVLDVGAGDEAMNEATTGKR